MRNLFSTQILMNAKHQLCVNKFVRIQMVVIIAIVIKDISLREMVFLARVSSDITFIAISLTYLFCMNIFSVVKNFEIAMNSENVFEHTFESFLV